MHLGASQFLGGDVLSQYRFDHSRSGQPEECIVRLDHKAALAGEIAAATGIKTEHAHDGGNDAAYFA